MSGNALSLKVIEAYTRDVGRGVARIGYDSMDTLNASTGDVIEIKGKKRTVAKCLPLYPSDEGKGIIRIDGLGRNNSGMAIGDTITVRKVDAVAAEKVVVAPLKPIPPIDERYLTDALALFKFVDLIKSDSTGACQITEIEQSRLDYSGTDIPSWVMTELGTPVARGDVSIDEFVTALEYVLGNA